MPFQNLLNVTFIPNTKKVKLKQSLTYTVPDDFPMKGLRGLEITSPEGSISDLASIPQVAQIAFSKIGKHRRAAVIHDKLYETGYYSKSVADLIFLHAMKDDNVNIAKRRLMYWAVKYGGHFAWREHRKHDKEEEA